LSHHEAIPALHEVHPRDLSSPAGLAHLPAQIWATRSRKTPPRGPTYAAINKIPGVHTALFSILAGGAEIIPHPARRRA